MIVLGYSCLARLNWRSQQTIEKLRYSRESSGKIDRLVNAYGYVSFRYLYGVAIAGGSGLLRVSINSRSFSRFRLRQRFALESPLTMADPFQPNKQHNESNTMPTGKIKWFDSEKGYGFIEQDEGGKDLFVHHTETDGSVLNDDQAVEFEIGKVEKGPLFATSVKKI